MQLSFRLDKRPGESHLALDGKIDKPLVEVLMCAMIYSFPNFAPVFSASGSREEPNQTSHMTDFSEPTRQPRYCQRGRPTTGSIFQHFPIANHRKYFPNMGYPWLVWCPNTRNQYPTVRVTPVSGSESYAVLPVTYE